MPVSKVTDRQGVALKWDEVDESQQVTVFATGEEGDVHNKRSQPNNGHSARRGQGRGRQRCQRGRHRGLGTAP